jgi:3-oxoacyl-[acyl-carrier-protein] synthase II
MAETVWITGIGVVSPLGHGPAFWEALVTGRSAICRMSARGETDAGGSHWLGAPVTDAWEEWLGGGTRVRRLDRFAALALASGELAWRDAGLDRVDPRRCGVVCGTGFGGIETLTAAQSTLVTRGPRRVGPFMFPALMANAAAAQLSIRFGLEDLSLAFMDDALSSAQAIAYAAQLIRRGEADLVLAGGAEAPLVPLILAGLRPFGLVPHGHRDLHRAVRPFSRRREGFVLGEGAALLVLESQTHATARQARPYAELAGHGVGMGGGTLVGAFAAAMGHALKEAGVAPTEVDHVHADGSATPAGDTAESQALHRVFGAHSGRLTVSATKAATGHLWGASGALELAITALSLFHQVAPPTLNWEAGDPACDLDYVPHGARSQAMRVALCNTRGLGQRAVALVLRNPGRSGASGGRPGACRRPGDEALFLSSLTSTSKSRQIDQRDGSDG